MKLHITMLTAALAACATARAAEALPVFAIVTDDRSVFANFWAPPTAGDPVQDFFQDNAPKYNYLILDDGSSRAMDLRGETVRNPDGELIETGVIHFRPGVPNSGVAFDVATDARDVRIGQYGLLMPADYLERHIPLPFTERYESWGTVPPLPADIVESLEQRYGMKASRSSLLARMDSDKLLGSVQFEGPWADAPADSDFPDRRRCLALDVYSDGRDISVIERLGYYWDENDFGWNVDDDGIYTGLPVIAAFEGPDGVTICAYHQAPESLTYGIYMPEGKRLVEKFSAGYLLMIDEPTPVWKSDIAAMQRAYVESDPANSGVTFTRWADVFIDYDHQWIWAADDSEPTPTGGIFRRDGDGWTLVAETGRNRTPGVAVRDNEALLSITGSAGGPAWMTEVHVFNGGEQTEVFSCLEVMGQVDGAAFNGRALKPDDARAYMQALPEFRRLDPLFTPVKR